MEEQATEKKVETRGGGLSYWSLVMIAVGQVVGAGIVSIIGASVLLTGRSAWLAYGAAVIMGTTIILPTAFFFSAVTVPGGTYGMVTRTLGPKTGGLMTISSLMSWTARGTAVISIGMYINSVFPSVSAKVGGTVVWTLLIITNMFGLDAMAAIQKVATPILLVALMMFAVRGISSSTVSPLDFQHPEMFTNGLAGFTGAMMIMVQSCMGQSSCAALATRCANPKRDLPKAILTASGIILVLYITVGIAASCVMPMDQIAGKPLTETARFLLPSGLFVFFMVGGPIFALLTTMNSGISGISMPTIAGVKEGWLPSFLAKENKRGVPWISYTIIWVIGLTPLLTGIPIQTWISFTLGLSGLIMLMVALAGFRMPSVFPDEWKSSRLHIPSGLYYAIISCSFAFQCYSVYKNISSLTPTLMIINIVALVLTIAYGMWRYKSGAIKRVDNV